MQLFLQQILQLSYITQVKFQPKFTQTVTLGFSDMVGCIVMSAISGSREL